MALEGVRELPAVHSLLRVADPSALVYAGGAPEWAVAALHRLPFVVVRRDVPRCGWLPVGIRGALRAQRAPAWLPAEAAMECITPRMLAARGAGLSDRWSDRCSDPCSGWGGAECSEQVSSPAVAVLCEVRRVMEAHGFADCWGPGGSVGAELASGIRCTTPSSDLDLILYVDSLPARNDARRLHEDLSGLPVRVDTLLETPQGGLNLADLLGADRMLLRTARGPRLIAATQDVGPL
jgi:phosphoribosyl-dephospho-CoA transferase